MFLLQNVSKNTPPQGKGKKKGCPFDPLERTKAEMKYLAYGDVTEVGL